jgi:hypothetical protein
LASEARLRIATIGDQISDFIQDHQPMDSAMLRIVDSAATYVARELAMLASSMPGSQTLASDPRTADPDPGIRDRRS